MKNVFKSLSIVSILAALAFTSHAQAATPGAITYAGANGIIFTMTDVAVIDSTTVPGYINLEYPSGMQSLVGDPTGMIMAKIRVNNPQLVQYPGRKSWFNPNIAQRITCFDSSTDITIYVYGSGGVMRINDPSCGMFNAIKALSN